MKMHIFSLKPSVPRLSSTCCSRLFILFTTVFLFTILLPSISSSTASDNNNNNHVDFASDEEKALPPPLVPYPDNHDEVEDDASVLKVSPLNLKKSFVSELCN